jgi:3-hydroxyisobutyrate dehydrogenase-like beta-hydroxyacid dehydrogenase
MAGGEQGDFERALALFEVMGEVIVHVGPLGKGQAVKLINNALAAANAAALAEALVLAQAEQLDTAALLAVLGAGSGASTMLSLKARPMLERDFTTLFKTDHMVKDVRLCLQEAARAEVPFPAAEHALELLEAAAGAGLGEADFAAIVEPAAKRAR